MFNKLGFRVILAALVLVLSACAEEGPEPIDRNAADVSNDGVSTPMLNVFDKAIAAGTFSTFISAIQTAGLDTVLADESETYTVFAPTDAAFAKLGNDVVNELLANPEALKNLLQYHVVPERAINSEDAISMFSDMDGGMLEMANGDSVSVNYDGDNFYINTSKVIVTDVIANNGVIHVIDTVLMPPVDEPTELNIVETIVADGSFEQLSRALVSTGLADTLSNTNDTFTLLAPNDEAFAKLPEDKLNTLLTNTEVLKNTLLYHVVDGEALDSTTTISLSGQQKRMANGGDVAIYLIDGKLKINEATITSKDVTASNGIIHVLDSILIPPAHSVDSPDHSQVAVGSIFDIAQNTPDFSSFSDAVQLAFLEGALGCPIDLYTVFLPTNAAFKALSQESRDRFFSDPVAMRQLVLLHTLPGRILDSTIAAEQTGFNLQAGNGEMLVITQQADTLWIEDAKILTSDITTVNGIVHTIDKVLLPQ